MKRIARVGALIVILVIPTLIVLFLKGFGQNHFKLRTFVPEIDSTSGQIKIQEKKTWYGSTPDTVFHTVPDFTLTDQDGKAFSSKQTKGKIYVANFIFTRCTSICPRMSSELTRVQAMFADNPSILLVSHSIDPVYDTPEVLKQYAKKYEAQSGKWYFLTGSEEQIYHLAHKAYFIAAKAEDGKTSPDETFTHSEKLILIDKEGHIRGFYDGTDKKDVDRLILEIKILLEMYKTGDQ
ncbi:MAG: SCO family protein [Spirosomataceae bacterium]